MNAATTPQCVSCGQRRCDACHIETHKLKFEKSDFIPPPAPSPPSPNPPQTKATAGPTTTTEHTKDSRTPFSDVIRSLVDDDIGSRYVNTVTVDEELELLRDLSLEEPNTHAALNPATRTSDDRDEMARLKGPHGKLEYFTQDDGKQASSGDPSPASEPWDYWEDNPELCGYNIDGEALLKAVQGPFQFLFQKWLEEVCSDDGDGEKGFPSSTSAMARSHSRGQSESKRKRVKNTENEDPESRSNNLRSTGKKSRKLMPLHNLLACPYFKKDPQRHRACCGFGFSKISYMKGHLYRNHAIPIYCPVCQQSFENIQTRDNHTIERNCEPVENGRPPDGITPEQRDWLHQRGPRSFSEEQQWFRIFEFLFPGHPLPRSAYNDTAFSEDLLNFRDFLSERAAQDTLLERVRENPQWTPELETIFRPDLVHGLDQLYWRWAATEDHENNRENPFQEPGTSSSQPESGETAVHTAQPEARVGESNASPASAVITQGASGGATPETADDLREDEEASLESGQGIASGELEQEGRKVDQSDQPPPRQLNHDGIAPVPEQTEWLPPDLSELAYTNYEPLPFTGDLGDELFAADDALLNLLDCRESAEAWISNFDLPGYEASSQPRFPEESPAGGSPVDLGLIETGEEHGVSEATRAEAEESEDFLIIAEP